MKCYSKKIGYWWPEACNFEKMREGDFAIRTKHNYKILVYDLSHKSRVIFYK